MSSYTQTLGAVFAAAMLLPVPAVAQEFRSGLDTNGSGDLDQNEFVMGFATMDMKRYDTNKDEKLTIAEFTEKDTPYKQTLVKKFNKDKDDAFSPTELVEMYLSIFAARDKDKSGTVTPAEAPGQFLKTPKK